MRLVRMKVKIKVLNENWESEVFEAPRHIA
jgi:hypothetical protein